jgi:hypothetical protein
MSQIIFKIYLVEFQEEGGRTSLGGCTSWDEEKVRKGEIWVREVGIAQKP